MTKLLSLLLFTLLCQNALAQYNLDDLKVLAEEKNFSEFVQHAQDIRPSQRNNWWKEQLRIMGKSFIEDRSNKKDYSEETFGQIEALYVIPSVKEDEFVRNRREEYNRAYLKNCFALKNKLDCFQKLEVFWESTKGSINRPEMALEFSDLLNKYNIQADQWKYLLSITTGSTAEFYCGRDDVKKQLLNKLTTSFNQKNDPKKFLANLKDLANKECLNKILPDLKSYLVSGNNSEAEMSYHLLKGQDQLDPLESDSFLVSFLMNGPVVGETFNLSWNTIEALGKDYDRREKVLERLKRYDPLPDELINSANNKKRDLLLDLMTKNFPEYLDYYAKTCLDYLEGKKQFPNGNPTKYCRELFKLSQDKNWVNSSLKLRYEALPKL